MNTIIDWWENRKESDVSWKVNIKDLKNWDLDIKNPNNKTEEINFSTTETIVALKKSFTASNSIIEKLETLLK